MSSFQPLPGIRCLPDKPAIHRHGCRLDVVVQLTTPPLPPCSDQRPPVAIAVVLDRSGSMAGPKLQAARSAAQQLLRQLEPQDRITVVSFDHEARTVVPLGAADEQAIAQIDRIRSGGQTALADGWQQGMTALRTATDLQGHHKRVVLLTDGQANVGLRRAAELAPLVGQARENAISTSCIGLGQDYDERLLTAMVEAGNGNLVHLTAPQQLEAVLAAELEGLNLTLGRELRLRLTPGPHVRRLRLHNPLQPDGEGWIRLGDLQAGLTPSLVLQLESEPLEDPEAAHADLLQVQAEWRDLDDVLQCLEAVLRLPVMERRAWEALPSDPDVQRDVLLQNAATERLQAMQNIDSGDLNSTRSAVKAALSSLERAPHHQAIERERQLLGELLDLLATDQLGLARKVMGTQAFMRARGRQLRDLKGQGDD